MRAMTEDPEKLKPYLRDFEKLQVTAPFLKEQKGKILATLSQNAVTQTRTVVNIDEYEIKVTEEFKDGQLDFIPVIPLMKENEEYRVQLIEENKLLAQVLKETIEFAEEQVQAKIQRILVPKVITKTTEEKTKIRKKRIKLIEKWYKEFGAEIKDIKPDTLEEAKRVFLEEEAGEDEEERVIILELMDEIEEKQEKKGRK